MFLKNNLKKAFLFFERCSGQIYRKGSNHNWSEWIDNNITSVPLSNGSNIYHRMKMRIGFICDEFIYENYKDVCDLVYLTPENWNKYFEGNSRHKRLARYKWRMV